MASPGRPSADVELGANERKTLRSWARRHSSAQSLAMRSKIVLGADEGLTNTAIAAKVGCHPNTASKWRNRFVADRLGGLTDADRPGAAPTITDDIVEAVVIDTLETAPDDATHWSTRELAKKHGLGHQRVAEIWRAFGLKPWEQDEFKVSPDPLLVDKIRDIVGLYLSPPVAAAVFCVDEKPQIQALNRTAPTLSMLPTTPARATHDYQRNGTIDLFAALNMATGEVITDLRQTHTFKDSVAFLNQINRNVADELDVHLILDNLSAGSDRAGIPVGWAIDAANRNDIRLLDPTLDAIETNGLLADIGTVSLDRSYDYPAIRNGLVERGLTELDIQKRGTKPPPGSPHRLTLGLRWIVEATNTWWTNYGQLRRNTDRRTRHRHAALQLATTVLIVGRLLDYRNRWSPKPTPTG